MKYELTNETMQFNSKILYRIKRLSDGKLGGWIEKYDNLSQFGSCWINDDAIVCDNAKIVNSAKIYGNAIIYENAYICDNVKIYDNVRIYGYAEISGNVIIKDYAEICGNVEIHKNARIAGNAKIYGNVLISDKVYIKDNAIICDNAELYHNARVYGNAKVYKNAIISNNTEIYGNACIKINVYNGNYSTTINKISYINSPKYTLSLEIENQCYTLNAYDGINIFENNGWCKLNEYKNIKINNAMIYSIYEFDVNNKQLNNINDYNISSDYEIRTNCYYIGISCDIKLDYLYYAVKKADLEEILTIIKLNLYNSKNLVNNKNILKIHTKLNILQLNTVASNLYNSLDVSSFTIIPNKMFKFGYKQFSYYCIEIIQNENSNKTYIGNCYDPLDFKHDNYTILFSMNIINNTDVKIFLSKAIKTIYNINTDKYNDIIKDLEKLYKVI